ncbi:MAG: hypothetical protein Q8N37_03500 [bacterium]|nr:hypothetical protein [bacterium]
MFQPNKTIKNIAFIFGVITLSAGLGYAVLAWTEPSVNPPNPDPNVSIPLNTGLTGQIKSGNLQVNALGIQGFGNVLLVPNGNVGIGTTNPTTGKLVVSGGNIDITGNRIINLAAPIASTDVATKGYVDAQSGGGGGRSGTIVLYDQGNMQGIKTTSWFSRIYLPSETCTAYANYCFGDNTIGNSKCVSKQIFNSSGNMFTVDLKPGTQIGSGGSCNTTYTKKQADTFIYATCSVTAWEWQTASASVSRPGATITSCSATGSCTYCASVSSSNSGTDAGTPAGTVYTASCGGCCTKSTSITEYSGELPFPLGHLEVTYTCP